MEVPLTKRSHAKITYLSVSEPLKTLRILTTQTGARTECKHRHRNGGIERKKESYTDENLNDGKMTLAACRVWYKLLCGFTGGTSYNLH